MNCVTNASVAIRFTAKERLETWAHISRVQSDEATYDLERSVMGSVLADITADRCGQCGACDRAMVPVDVGNREISDMEITQAAYAEAQMEISRLRERIATLEAQYHELLFAVGNKSPGETRHQTALRYIQQAERAPQPCDLPSTAPQRR